MTSVPGYDLKSKTPIHIMALDGIVNVNSLFTLALFLGLSINPTDPTSTLATTTCSAANTSVVAEHLIASHVYSFSSFLFSSLIAFALKQSIKIFGSSNVFSGRDEEVRSVTLAQVNRSVLRTGILVSAVGSVSGCVFLVLALIDLVQIKLGMLACRSLYSYAAVVPLVVLVPSALVIYISIVFHAFAR